MSLLRPSFVGLLLLSLFNTVSAADPSFCSVLAAPYIPSAASCFGRFSRSHCRFFFNRLVFRKISSLQAFFLHCLCGSCALWRGDIGFCASLECAWWREVWCGWGRIPCYVLWRRGTWIVCCSVMGVAWRTCCVTWWLHQVCGSEG